MILIVVDFGGGCQIPRFKSALEDEGLIIRTLALVESFNVDLDQLLLLGVIVFGIL